MKSEKILNGKNRLKALIQFSSLPQAHNPLNPTTVGVPLVFLWCASDVPSMAEKNAYKKSVVAGVPLLCRRSTAGVPSVAGEQTKRTTYHSDR